MPLFNVQGREIMHIVKELCKQCVGQYDIFMNEVDVFEHAFTLRNFRWSGGGHNFYPNGNYLLHITNTFLNPQPPAKSLSIPHLLSLIQGFSDTRFRLQMQTQTQAQTQKLATKLVQFQG